MADPVADNADFAVDELKRKARRRLVGAIVIALAAATILPLVLEQEQKPLGDDVSVQIPAIDSGKFVSRLKDDKGSKAKDALPGAKPEGAPDKAAADAGAASPAPAPGASTAADLAPATASTPKLADAASRTAPVDKVDVDAVAPDAKAAPPDAKSESRSAPRAAPKADAKAKPGADVPPRAHAVKPEPQAATATPPASVAPAASAPPPVPADAAPPAEATATAAAAPRSAVADVPMVPASPAGPPTAEATRAEGYVVQLGAFTDNYGANALANKLKKAGYPAFTEPVETSRGTLWRVRVGGYPSRPAALQARHKLKADGHDGVVTAAK